jgi:hypothetical protein
MLDYLYSSQQNDCLVYVLILGLEMILEICKRFIMVASIV